MHRLSKRDGMWVVVLGEVMGLSAQLQQADAGWVQSLLLPTSFPFQAHFPAFPQGQFVGKALELKERVLSGS